MWTADASKGDRYLTPFNMHDKTRPVGVDLRHFGLSGSSNVRDLWARTDLGSASGRFARTLPPHGAGLYRLN